MTMELAEVVNPHFAVPVVGVILCVFLVFAFGFKSPVQPPSFIFEDESKKSRARSKQKKKSQPVSTEQLVPKQSASSKVIAKPVIVSDKTEEPAAKTKAKKTSGSPKLTVTKQKNKTQPKPADDNEGEWTTARSKKRKPRPGKKDEVEHADTERTDEVSCEVAPDVIAAPPVVQPTSDVVNKDVDKVDQSADETSMQIKPISTEAVAAPPVISKKKAKKERRSEIVDEVLLGAGDSHDTGGGGVGMVDVNGTQRKIEAELLAAMQDDDKAAGGGGGGDHNVTADPPQVDSTVLPSGTAKSPKKKKKSKETKANTESAMKSSEKPVDAVLPSDKLVSSTTQQDVPREASRTEEPPSAPSSEATAVDSSKPAAVTFDELGEWQEAKPVKKKKKARRDN